MIIIGLLIKWVLSSDLNENDDFVVKTALDRLHVVSRGTKILPDLLYACRFPGPIIRMLLFSGFNRKEFADIWSSISARHLTRPDQRGYWTSQGRTSEYRPFINEMQHRARIWWEAHGRQIKLVLESKPWGTPIAIKVNYS